MQSIVKFLNNRKAAEADGIFPEFVINVGLNCNWIEKLAIEIGKTGTIPNHWLESRVTTILKPNKFTSDSNHYRLISLVSKMYQLFQRFILVHLQPSVGKFLPVAPFGRNRNCCD